MVVDVAAITNTAQAIANLNVNATLSLVLIGIIGIINVVALFVKFK